MKKLQESLVQMGYMTKAQVKTGPGTFGPRTEAAVKQFQRDQQLPQTGFFGPMTRAAMSSVFGNRSTTSPAASGRVGPTAPAGTQPRTTPTGAPTQRPVETAPTNTQGRFQNLGSLSRRYESNGNPGTVSTGVGDRGGVSYGTYQFATNTGSAQAFVDSLRNTHPEYHRALSGSRPGTPEFSAAWRDLARRDPQGFAQAQHDHIQSRFYDPAVRNIERSLPGINLSQRSKALNDVVWSTAVQHGTGGANTVFSRALAGTDPSRLTDAQIIERVYAERGRRNASGSLAYFSGSSQAVQQGVANRFRSEQADALAALRAE